MIRSYPPSLWRLILGLGMFFGLHGWSFAQFETATISGRITDPQGSVIPRAHVKAVNIDTNNASLTYTNGAGVYVLPGLKPGRYRLQIDAEGFRQIVKTDLVLQVQDVVSQNFSLQLGSVSQSITVTANDAAMPTESPAVGLVVTKDFVENTPLNGRSFQDLIALAPGVVDSADHAGLFTINGQRSDANYYTVDGVAANTDSSPTDSITFLAGVAPANTALGTTQSLLSVDAMQEFKVQTSTYMAENGRQPGGQIELTSRSGTNDLHGTAYDYFRNEAFDGNDWLAKASGISRQAHRQNDIGGTLGGPLIIPHFYDGKNKTFYFISYEGLRLKQPSFGSAAVPTSAFDQFASPEWRTLLSAYPISNGPDNADPCVESFNPSLTFACTARWSGSYSNPSTIDSTSIRFDQIIGGRLQLFARYWNTPSRTTGFNANGTGSDEERAKQHSTGITLGGTWRLSSNLVAEGRFNWTKNTGAASTAPAPIGGAVTYSQNLVLPPQYTPSDTGSQGEAFVLLPGPVSESLAIPFYSTSPVDVRQKNVVGNLSLARSRHGFKFGGDLRRLQALSASQQYSPAFAALSASSVTLGNADIIATNANALGHPTFTNLSLYAEDSWKVTGRLTLDYGVRWELNPVPGAVNGKYPLAITTSNLATAQLAASGTRPYHTSYDKVAPRFGFAFEALSSPKHPVIVRGGFGLFYDTAQTQAAAGYGGYPFGAQQVQNGTFTLPLSPSLLAPPNLNVALTPPYPFLNGISDPNLTLPYTEQWSFAISTGLSTRNTLTTSYVGNSGRKLLFTEQYNDVSSINPIFTSIRFTNNAGSSSYNALQLQDQGYLTKGMQLIASYTWAHALDNVSQDAIAYPPLRGNSDNDIRQVFQAGINYQVPAANSRQFSKLLTNGWSFDARFAAQTGYPVQVIQGEYLLTPGNVTAPISPDLVRGVPLVLLNAPGDPFGWALNPAAFSQVPVNADGSPARQGNLPRNFVRGPDFWNLNFGFQRGFPLNERVRLTFRAEAFNLFNHPNPSSPDRCLCDGASFGKIEGIAGLGVPNPLYATGSPRSLQLLLKVSF